MAEHSLYYFTSVCVENPVTLVPETDGQNESVIGSDDVTRMRHAQSLVEVITERAPMKTCAEH
jgi:hypothetical protein